MATTRGGRTGGERTHERRASVAGVRDEVLNIGEELVAIGLSPSDLAVDRVGDAMVRLAKVYGRIVEGAR